MTSTLTRTTTYPEGAIVTWDNEEEPVLTAFDLRSWLGAWVRGVNLWDEMFEQQEVTLENPFTGKPVKTQVTVRAKGVPWLDKRGSG